MNSVSVIIPTFRRPSMVAAAVTSALSQGEVEEVIVVDDNGGDEHSLLTESAVDTLSDNRVVFVRNARTKGGCGARNTGILTARCEFVAFLDDDDALLPGAMSTQLASFDCQAVGMVYGGSIVVDEVYMTRRTVMPKHNRLTFDKLLDGSCPNTSSVVMVRKSAIIDVGLFDESLPSLQDYDMWLRIAKKYEIRANHNVVANFVSHQGDRTSVNIARRLEGIRLIVKKLQNEISLHSNKDEFENRFVSSMFLTNGHLALAVKNGGRVQALSLLWRAFKLAPKRKGRYLVWLVAGALGYKATRFIKKMVALT